MAETTTKRRGIDAGGRRFQLEWAGVTDVGLRRDTNQDSFFAEYPLFIVADGMGGHAGGEIASQRTIARLEALLAEGQVNRPGIESALELVVGDIAAHPETTDEGTGTTLTGVFLEADGDDLHWVALNIGDSRVYLLREGRLVQVTTDHSVVQELIAAGKISPDEAEGHPYSNVITRAVGASELTAPDYVTIDVRAGDRFVICSDGLTKELTDYGIQHFLNENADPGAAVDAMLAAALENGGRDNVTLVIVQVAGDSSSTEETSEH
ncbi:PP2C-family Ser/Thr phosphatase [Microbacterium hydrocarbonoxydans]|uniref:PP2C-family Ser/Thr phosphatase n=1 Tax=Microbacterium hydrocarbonoxydans TaxID=273678 RepID=A0A0M2HJ27_9MICO|nr:protein phosphatase 2C domain-containing protein [Microbacterium hydrocarbonoxydans]KJL46735.1 PP2C-family Ser/Thr phosphatase [Microbacterium hydrocarbonoxydans]